MLGDGQRDELMRRFFTEEWGELAAILDEHELTPATRLNNFSLGQTLRACWRNWRDRAVQQMAKDGRIANPSLRSQL